MPNDPDLNDPVSLWRSQDDDDGGKVTITLNDLRRQVARAERRVYWRNMREYGAGVFVLAAFTVQLWHAHGWQIAPPLLLIAGTLYVMFQLHRRGSVESLPEDAGLRTSLDFHIRELSRQRDALQTVWLWYLLPLVPGFVAALLLRAADGGINFRLIVSAAVLVGLLFGIWQLNEWAARKIDRRVQELKKMGDDDE